MITMTGMFPASRLFAAKLIIAICGLIWTVSGAAIAGPQRLVLTGSSTVAPLINEIARRFEMQFSGVRIDVQTGGSSRGINDVRKRIADIGMVSRPLKPDENDLHAYTVALDGISLLVHADNPVNALNKSQIAGIFTGDIVRWRDVGGKDARITVVNKAEGRSTLELFLDYLQLKNSAIKPHIIIGDNAQGIKTVTGNRNAIGYVSIGAAEYEVQRGASLRLLALDGVEATVENVRNGTFPLSRPLNLVTASDPQGVIKQFIGFAQSPQVQDLIKAQHFVPVDAD
ncbi:phosphate ABC transporter substrate-binding protein [Nitrosomonas marina]|uniref:Phosphate ABC transporter substrate-binding protein, PhoT family n=1 Tax=Nitrosomonas marina TaxID=917 RepID=A0A1H8E4J9_9PROT|nr:phosphate ABC transporter substrate-binding protein [Nitrosomonas marina]SEN14499.1 phosphate ABC transporter substrate-binding protein, PhoT family [Nitrosomonas marina]